ncbi:MAG: LAGLIDADG family homing endonuclease, partial [Pseudomonadota bacterium]
MSGESFLDGRVTLYAGDCLDVLTRLEECSVDACVTDPPYHLTSIVKRFGADNAAPARLGKDGRFGRLSGGFMNRKWDAPDVPAIEPGFAFWMAGFIDGEGCFSVHKKIVNNCETYDCQFSMTLRDDDKDIIVEIQRQLGGIGSIAHRPAARDGSNGKPQVRYCISSQKDCWRLREVLTVFPLRAKKARDFEIWSQALDAWITHEPGSSWEDVAYFRDALMAVRRYGADFHPSQLWAYRWARQIFRVLKPGAHLVAFGGTRTYHRMACAIEDAGFEIRDQLAWVYGSGFPKSHDVSKGIDATLIIGKSSYSAMADVEDSKGLNLGKADSSFLAYGSENSRQGKLRHGARRVKGKNITAAALEWQGWGTALKPSWEPIVLARKPLSEPTIAANVLRWGTGGLNIDGCRVEGETVSNHARGAAAAISKGIYGNSVAQETYQTNGQKLGRWPANLVHDGSEEVLAGFP